MEAAKSHELRSIKSDNFFLPFRKVFFRVHFHPGGSKCYGLNESSTSINLITCEASHRVIRLKWDEVKKKRKVSVENDVVE